MAISFQPCRLITLDDVDAAHFEYFRVVCSKEFSLQFEETSWERIVLQAALAEPWMRHAALAVGALSRVHYLPVESQMSPFQAEPMAEYATKQYNLAIQKLNRRLDSSCRSWELALLGSIIFIAIEVLQKCDNRVGMHLQSAFAILESYPGAMSSPRTDAVLGSEDSPFFYYSTRSLSNLDLFVDALNQLSVQLSSFLAFSGGILV